MSESWVRKRARQPKTRTGCITCKKRHVKCDEAKPQCKRCVTFGIECDGYALALKNWRPDKKPTNVVVLPKPLTNELKKQVAPRRSTQVLQKLLRPPPFTLRVQPSALPPFEQQSDYVYFTTFRQRASVELSGYFDTNVWSRTILQLCHEEDFARHAVVAIGALHTAMEVTQDSNSPSIVSGAQESIGESHHRIALQRYAKALRLMRELPERKGHAWLRCILFSCLLTTCFENYIGNIQNSINSAQAGIDLLLDRGTQNERGKSEEDLSHVLTHRSDDLNDLLSTFARFESYIIMFNNARGTFRHLRASQIDGLATFQKFPTRFTSVKEVRLYTDFLARNLLRWRDVSMQLSNTPTLEIDEPDPVTRARKIRELSRRAEIEVMHAVEGKQQWFKAFEPLFEESRKSPGSKEYLGASTLMIQYVSTKFMTHILGQNSEVFFDRMVSSHMQVVELARDLLENCNYSNSKKAVFTFDDGFVSALFLVGTRCREPAIRRQAIKLMVDYPRREGLWDSTVAARIAIWLMKKEEEGMVDGFVPEISRLRISKLDVRFMEKRAIIRCSRWNEQHRNRIEMEDVIFNWGGA